jgi:hypothetical protein
MNSSAIFYGFDGLQMLAFIGERYRFTDIIFGLGSDPVIGLGNIAYTVNPRWFPSYALTADTSGYIQHKPLAFAVAATELFAATVLCGRMNGFSLTLSFAAGWLITLTVWQLFGGPPYIVNFVFVYPHHAELLSVVVLMASFALRVGDDSWAKNIALTTGFFLCLSFILFAEPTTLILALPVVGLFSASTLLLAPCSRYKIVMCWASLALACLILGYIHYMAGLLNYTAAAQFPDISKRSHTFYSGQVSLLLWTPVSSWGQIFTPERAYVGGGLIGNIIMLWLGSPLQRRLALGVLGAEAVFLTIGLSNYFLDYWFGPAVWYFETFLFPFFALGICFLATSPILLARRFIQHSRWASSELQWARSSFANATVPILLALAAVVQFARAGEVLKARSPETDIFAPMASPFPQPETSITHILKEEIKLVPGQRFRGRVAVFIGLIFPEKRRWDEYSLGHYFAQFATGNLHDGPGLWQDDIPTLMEFNTLISPPNFAFLRTFLTNPTDIMIRTAIGMRRIDQRILKAIGVRFVISDQPIADAALRAQVTIPTPPVARERLGFAYKTMESFELYLYELADVNIGQFSPNEVRQSSDANQMLTEMSNDDLRLDQVVFASEPLPNQLQKAELIDFRVERDAFRIRAKSEGPSVLLLPWEFSQCLKITTRTGAARLFRADLFLTGVLFEGDLDATITFHTGPLIDSRCRLKDLHDSHQLKIRNAFDDRPTLGNMR